RRHQPGRRPRRCAVRRRRYRADRRDAQRNDDLEHEHPREGHRQGVDPARRAGVGQPAAPQGRGNGPPRRLKLDHAFIHRKRKDREVLMRRIGRRTAALAAATMIALTGCSTGGGSESDANGGGEGLAPTVSAEKLREHAVGSLKGKTAAFVPVGLGTPLTEEWARQMKRGFEAAGMKFVLRDPNWDTARQAEAVQSLINDKPAVLVVHNFDVQVLAKLIQQAEKAGIYVIQINMVSNYKSDAFVGADTIDLGRRIATDIVKECGAGTNTSHKVQIVQGDATSGFTLDVMAGAKSVFDKHKEIKIVSTQAANWDR